LIGTSRIVTLAREPPTVVSNLKGRQDHENERLFLWYESFQGQATQRLSGVMNGKEALALDRQTVGTLLQASRIHLFLVWCRLVFTQDGATQENKKNQEVSSEEKKP